MNQVNKYIFITLLIIFPFTSSAQNEQNVKLAFDEFLKMVKQYHPIAKQADFLVSNAKANKLTSKGGVDPKIFYDFQNKYYDSKSYYQLSNGGLQIPTWYGIDFKVGLENNFGQFVNPQNVTANQGLSYAQISLPLLQGLLIDERRATLKKAMLFDKMSLFDKTIMLNDLIYQAGKSYWDWQLAYANLQVFQSALNIAQQRFNAVKRTVVLGDRPAIDTVESYIQLQERLMSVQQSQVDFKEKTLWLSNYMWLDNNIPIELTEKSIPEKFSISLEQKKILLTFLMNTDSLIDNHPEIKVYEFKRKQNEIDFQLKKDKLKPTLNIQYNPLGQSTNLNWLSLNNYKWGFGLGFPLLLRKERGEVKMAKIKIDNIVSEMANKKNILINKVKLKQFELENYKNQYTIYTKTVDSYEQLWLSEKQLFDTGESSLFMINSREMSYINAQLKLNDMYTKNKKAIIEVLYALGQIENLAL